MAQFIYKGISLDEDTAKLLKIIADAEADGERTNESLVIRRMIRKQAKELGISIPTDDKKRAGQKVKTA